MKYFRTFPWGLQLILFLLMSFTMSSFGLWCVGMLLPKFSGATLDQVMAIGEHSPYELVKIGIVVTGVLSIMMYMVTSLVFAYLTHPDPKFYLGIRKPGKAIQPLLAVLAMLGAIPVLEGIQTLVSMLPFSADAKAAQDASKGMTNAFLNIATFPDFIRTFIVMAIVPGIGEELFFRSILMRFAARTSRSILFAIVFSAVIFAAAHTNLFGMLSIFLAGSLLAVIYYYTGSILCSMLAHISFNGTQVVLSYLAHTSASVGKFMASDAVPLPLIAGGGVVFAVSFYLLYKSRTVLPPYWVDDFDRLPKVPEAEPQK